MVKDFECVEKRKKERERKEERKARIQVYRDSPGGPMVKTLHIQSKGPGLISSQGTIPHMLQLRPGAAK